MFQLASELHGWPQILSHSSFDPGSLHYANTMADERPGRRLVGRIEADRAQPRIACLQPPHHRVPFAHFRKFAPVHVEREDAPDLRPHHPNIRLSRHLTNHRLIPGVYVNPGDLLTTIGDESETQVS